MGSAGVRPKCPLFWAIALAWLPLLLLAAAAPGAGPAPARRGSAAEAEHHGAEEVQHGGAEEAQHGAAEAPHGGAEGGHHAEGHEHGHAGGHHGHGEPSSAMVTTSFLLLGFLATNFVMLWLVNWPDPHVRSSIWKMISGTVSIYLAVLIINSASAFVLYVITGDPEGAQGFNEVHLCLRLSIFMACFVIGNFLCYRLREWKHSLYATQVIGAHITAFAGIGAFRVVTGLEDSAVFFCGGVVAVFLFLFRSGSWAVRCWYSGTGGEGQVGYDQLVQRLHKNIKSKHHMEDHWRHAVCEAEDDACSIIASYVVKELVLILLFEREKDELLHKHTRRDIKMLCMAQGACILLIVGLSYARRSLDRKFQQRASNPLSLHSRSLSSIQIMVAMTMSWLALYLFFWITADVFPDVEHTFVEIISAAILTASAIVGIMVMDKFADKVEELETTQLKETDSEERPDSEAVPTKTESVAMLQETLQDFHEEAMKQALDLQNMEKALRMLIEGFALAVGLAWEKAFHAALLTVVTTFPVSRHHQVISQFCMAFFSCLLMLPIWLRFIVPMAQKSVQDFQARIDLDMKQS